MACWEGRWLLSDLQVARHPSAAAPTSLLPHVMASHSPPKGRAALLCPPSMLLRMEGHEEDLLMITEEARQISVGQGLHLSDTLEQ